MLRIIAPTILALLTAGCILPVPTGRIPLDLDQARNADIDGWQTHTVGPWSESRRVIPRNIYEEKILQEISSIVEAGDNFPKFVSLEDALKNPFVGKTKVHCIIEDERNVYFVFTTNGRDNILPAMGFSRFDGQFVHGSFISAKTLFNGGECAN